MTLPILLVHGSFHTGECWKMVMPHLAERELDVRAVTLSGHRSNTKSPWLASMASYGADIVSAAEAIGAPCVVVGHSMGGVAISEAAQRRPDLFARMIYLSAFVPRIGKHSSLHNLVLASLALRTGMTPSFRGVFTIPPEIARQVFYHRCERDVQDLAIGLLCPQPMRSCIGVVNATVERVGSVPKHYIECLDDEALPLSSQRAMQAHMQFQSVHAIDSDHSPFFCKPALLADLIEQLSRG